MMIGLTVDVATAVCNGGFAIVAGAAERRAKKRSITGRATPKRISDAATAPAVRELILRACTGGDGSGTDVICLDGAHGSRSKCSCSCHHPSQWMTRSWRTKRPNDED